MNNRFLSAVVTFIQGTLAKSADVNTAFAEVGAGFDAVQDEMNVSLRGPATEKATNLARLPAAAARAAKWVAFDAMGNPIATMALPADMDAANHRVRNLIAPAANDEPVTLGYLTAYSGALAGIPPLAGNNGKFLTTDGVGVQWTFGGAPATVTTDNGAIIVSSTGAPQWAIPGSNLIEDPNGLYGADSWTGQLTSGLDGLGLNWRNGGILVTQTFDQQGAEIAIGAGLPLVFAADVCSSGVSAGAVSILLKFFDAAHAALSESAATVVPNGTLSAVFFKRFLASAITPASTAFVRPILRCAAVSSAAVGLRMRNPKVELGTNPTPFTDDQFRYRWRYTGQYNLGKGIVTVDFTLGDTTTTQSSWSLRSAAGAQAYDVRLKSTGGTNGTPGKGIATIEAAALVQTGAIGYDAELNLGNSGAGALVVNLQSKAYQKLTLTGNAAISFDSTTPPLAVGRYRVKLVQDGVGGRAPTWPTGAGKITVTWQAGTSPVPATAIGAITFVDLYWDGANLFGSWTPWS